METRNETVSGDLLRLHFIGFHIRIDIINHQGRFLIPHILRQHGCGRLSVCQIIDPDHRYIGDTDLFTGAADEFLRIVFFTNNKDIVIFRVCKALQTFH